MRTYTNALPYSSYRRHFGKLYPTSSNMNGKELNQDEWNRRREEMRRRPAAMRIDKSPRTRIKSYRDRRTIYLSAASEIPLPSLSRAIKTQPALPFGIARCVGGGGDSNIHCDQ